MLAISTMRRRFERVDVRTVRLERDADDVRAVAPQHADRAIVGRRFGQHAVTRLQQVEAKKLDNLQRSIAGEHAIGSDVLPFREPLAQRLESCRRSILQHRDAATLQGRLRGVDHFFDRKRFVRGHAAGEVDGVHEIRTSCGGSLVG